MTGFVISEFMELFAIVEKSLVHTSRGKKPTLSPLDSFFLTLVMLKHHEKWEKFAITYGIKRSVIQNSVTSTLKKIKNPLMDALVTPLFKDEQEKKNYRSPDFPEVALVIDVTFQARSRPTMLFKDAMVYFSGKHSTYGYKTEIGHAPNGLAMLVSNTNPGSIHDFTIFKESVDIYKDFLKKRPSDRTISDNGELKDKYPDSWAAIMDKGYQGASEIVRAIHPQKGRNLCAEDELRNDKIASTRVICENFYGRMKKLFKIMDDKYRWEESMYSTVMGTCVALTNYHILKNPLRSDDGDYNMAVLAKYGKEELAKKRKRSDANRIYREKQRRITL